MDRLARSIIDAADIIQRASEQGWSLVVLDLGVDLTTASGEAMAHMLAVFAQFERRLISERTKAALAARKARGESHGRKPQSPPAVVRRIVKAREQGETFAAIAKVLEAESILSPQGLPTWQSSSVRRIYDREAATTEAA